MLTEAFYNKCFVDVLESDIVNSVYTLRTICTAFDFLASRSLYKICKTEAIGKSLFFVIGTLCIAAAASLLFMSQIIIFLISSTMALLLFGYTDRCAHYNRTVNFAYRKKNNNEFRFYQA